MREKARLRKKEEARERQQIPVLIDSESHIKNFPNVNHERVLRKTETHELIERTFTTQPKYRRRIRRGHTIIIERCKDIMQALWQDNFRVRCTKKDLDRMVFLCAGGDYRTRNKYIGYYREQARELVDGYLQRLGFIQRIGGSARNGVYLLNHFKVNRDYHVKQAKISPIRAPNNESMPCINKMCVSNREDKEQHVAMAVTVASDGNELINNNNIPTHTQKSKVKVKHNRYASEHIELDYKNMTYLDLLAKAKILDSEPDRSTSVKEVDSSAE